MAYATTHTATTSTLMNRLGATLRGVATRYREHRMYRQTFDGLSALSNRELADLGLNRSELRFVSRESARNCAR